MASTSFPDCLLTVGTEKVTCDSDSGANFVNDGNATCAATL